MTRRHSRPALGLLLHTALVFLAAESHAQMTAHFIDVGQGDATLLEFPCGAVLIDTGGEQTETNAPGRVRFDSNEVLTDYLDAFFARRSDLEKRLDFVALTHAHVDHTRGAYDVWQQYDVRNLIYNGRYARFTTNKGLRPQSWIVRKARSASGVGIFGVDFPNLLGVGETLTNALPPFPSPCGGAQPKIKALWGALKQDPGWGYAYKKRLHFDNENNHSLVLRVDYGAASILFTGDLQDKAIGSLLDRYAAGTALDADVLQVGHHGSHNATTKPLLDEVQPGIAVVSAGPGDREGEWTAWDHGHPRRDVVKLLTDAVTCRRDAVDLTVFDGENQFGKPEQSPPRKMNVSEAVFSTGSDGTVVLVGTADGKWTLQRPSGKLGC